MTPDYFTTSGNWPGTNVHITVDDILKSVRAVEPLISRMKENEKEIVTRLWESIRRSHKGVEDWARALGCRSAWELMEIINQVSNGNRRLPQWFADNLRVVCERGSV